MGEVEQAQIGRLYRLARDCRHDERQRCIEIIEALADALTDGQDAARAALAYAVQLIRGENG